MALRQVPRWLAGLGVAATGLFLAVMVLQVGESHSRAAGLVLLALGLLFTALVLGNVRRLLLTILILDIPLQWDVNLFYHDSAARYGAFAGLNLSMTTLALAGLYSLWIADWLSRGEDVPTPWVRVGRPLLFYVGITSLSLLVARDKELAWFQIILLVQTLLLFVYITSHVQRREDVRFFISVLLWSLLIEGVLIVAIYLGGDQFSFLGVKGQSVAGIPGIAAQEQLRSGGTVGAPNAAAAFVTLLLAPAAAVLATRWDRRLKQLAAASFAAGTVALIVTFSRGGWIAFAVSMLVLSAVGVYKGWLRARVPVSVALGVLILISPFLGAMSDRLSRYDAGSAQSRIPLIHLAWKMIQDHPLLGVGANNFALFIPDYAGPEFSRNFLYVVHDKYFLVWSEAGTFALIAFLWFFAATLRRAWHCAQVEDPYLSPLAFGFLAAIAGELIQMAVDTFSGRPITQLLWLIAGLLAAMAAIMGLETAPERAAQRRAPAFARPEPVR